jgi:Zn-finger nucleic acid-binding protein
VIVACRSCGRQFEAPGFRDAQCPDCGEITTMARACAACTRPVVVQRIAGVALEPCGSCGGTFIGTEAINLLLAERDAQRADAVISAVAANLPSSANDTNAQRKCPSCATTLARTLSPEGAGIIIDVCKLHGVFLDAGELRRMLEFVRRETRERAELRAGRPPAIGEGADANEPTLEETVIAAVAAVYRFLGGKV